MKKTLIAVVLSAIGFTATAQETFLQLSLVPDIALASRDTVINGVSLSIWGENEQHALAIGFVNGSKGHSSGLSWGLVNYAESYKGVHLGFVNWATDEFQGLQWGTVNFAEKCNGVQVGAVNWAREMRGVQIGFVNVIESNGWFDEFPDKLAKGFPFVNWSF